MRRPGSQTSASLAVIAASVFNRPRVDRASRSSRVTVSTSPAASWSVTALRKHGAGKVLREEWRAEPRPTGRSFAGCSLSRDALAVGSRRGRNRKIIDIFCTKILHQKKRNRLMPNFGAPTTHPRSLVGGLLTFANPMTNDQVAPKAAR